MSMIRSVIFCAALLVSAEQMNSQALISQAGTMPTAKQGLDATVTLKLESVPLAQALRAIARQADVNVILAEPVIAITKRVTVQANNIPAGTVFRNAIAGTGVTMTHTQTGQIIFSKGNETVRAQGTVSGKVTDAKTGKGVSGVNVSIDGGASGAQTAEDGSYKLTGISAGTRIVSVRLVGYAKQSRSITVGEGAAIVADFSLEPSANVLDQVVVTGTVVATELKAVPNAITVITAKQLEERGITRLDQLFRGDVPGLFAMNLGSGSPLDSVTMFSRGATRLPAFAAQADITNPIKTYVDGVEMANSSYLTQIDPNSIERIEILTGPQASTIYGSNALNGVMQIFTKRGAMTRPQVSIQLSSGVAQNNFTPALAPSYTGDVRISGTEGRWSYSTGGSVDYVGSWTPAKNTTRYSGNGGVRMGWGRVTTNLSARKGLTTNIQRGQSVEGRVRRYGTGEFFNTSINTVGNLQTPSDFRQILNGRTIGLTVDYAPVSWSSHELVLGADASDIELISQLVRYSLPRDTTLTYQYRPNTRTSQRYTTTTRISLGSWSAGTFTLGGDRSLSRSAVIFASPVSLTGALTSPNITRNKPGKNAGGFFQSQLSFKDALFVTYGLRAEWNPNYGAEAQPNVVPRYGVSYTREAGPVTAKLRSSYGRSTRPPAESQKLADPDLSGIELYGPHDSRLANVDLGPEFQQGGEGGIELYLGNRGSMVITRYNQTVDALIALIRNVDSVPSLQQYPPSTCTVRPDGYCYIRQSQYLNVGSIRNQGWELQGSVNTGPFTTRGTYSWTKSRVIGITPRYRSLLTGTQYQIGRAQDFMTEHTWMLGVAYARAATNLSITVNGIGQLYKVKDAVYRSTVENNDFRDFMVPLRFSLPGTYRSLGTGYMMADLNAAHRISNIAEAVLQVRNLTDFYQNDENDDYASMGRQTKLGFRIRFQ